MPLSESVPDQVWLKEYPIHFAGCDFNARMSVIRNSDAKLLLRSPCEIDSTTKDEIVALGEVTYIVAPGSYHHLHIPSAQTAFPDAETHICPGIERKRPDLDFNWFLGDHAPEYQMGWKDKSAARKCLMRILDWDFDKIILSHGDLIERNAKERELEAWDKPLNATE